MKNKGTVYRNIVICLVLVALGIVGLRFWRENRANNPEVTEKNRQQTITVADVSGRKVLIPAKVERIACMYAFAGHVVAMLGRGQDIVAVVDGLKRDVFLTIIYPNIKNARVPVVEGSINIEELIGADPDVVFVKTDTANNPAETAKLDKFHLPYFLADYQSIKEQQFTIAAIGEALGATDKARKYNEYYQNCIERVQSRVAKIPDTDKIRVYHSVNEATRTDTPDSVAADWTQKAGVINVSVNQSLKLVEGKYYASLEQIILWNPQVIIANEPGVADYIMKNPQWASLTAVKQKKVYQMPIGISRWGHPGSLETPLAILWTAKKIYPSLFEDLNIIEETRNFYQEFYNYKLSDEMLTDILNGKGMRINKGE